MRLLFVIDCLGSGGAQRQMVNLALGLTARGHRVEFFLYYPQFDHFSGSLVQTGIPIHACEKRSRFSTKPLVELYRLIRREEFDVVLSFLSTPSFYSEICGCGCGSKNLRLIVSERYVYTSDSLPPSHWLLQQAHRLADYITVNSHHQRERMERLFPWMRRKITTIYNGVDLGTFKPLDPPAYRATTPVNLLALGTVVSKKNAIGLIRGLHHYHDKFKASCKVCWAGKVSHNDESRREFYAAQKLIFELGLQDHWIWLGERKDVPELLRSCDALIHPSFYEGLPNAICEALACGRPVLAGNVCDHPRLVQDGLTGFLFDPSNPTAIAAAILRFAELNKEDRNDMGRQARLLAERELSLDVYVSRYEKLFQTILNKNRLNAKE